jgi:hypothetical protein
MKTFTTIRPWSYHYRHFAVPGQPRLVGQWRHGIETISGYAKWMHFVVPSPTPALATVNHHKQPCRDVDFSRR